VCPRGPEGGAGLDPGLTRRKALALVGVTVFAVAMAYVESAVVAYLRFLYYPGGFGSDLTTLAAMAPRTQAIEIGREAATVVMLVAVALLAARRSAWERVALFIWAFAVWDIFYYVWLYAILRWPRSLMTLDVLFLIPRVWVAPVLLPVVVSGIMMAAALAILRRA
jgi:hypothetical protein